MRQLTPAGQKVFDARYAGKDENGCVNETFAEAVARLARTAAGVEKKDKKAWEEKFSHIIGELLFIPSTPIWANMGKTDRPWQPGACFVLAVEDTLESMYDTLKDTALVFKSGGGVGFNFSSIRPRGDLVGSTKGQASGVVELIRLYDASASMVKQGGVRRGAIIGILNIDHPEIVDFIQAKKDGGLTNFNLSVGVTDAFMEALEKDLPWQLVFNGSVRRELPARRLWEMIIESAHSCGDPGVVFLDRLQEGNPVPENPINATNPCVTGSTWVMTDEGPRQVVDLLGSQFSVVADGCSFKTSSGGFFKTGEKQVVRLDTCEGYSIRLTADHKVLKASSRTRYLIKKEWTPVADLTPGDKIVLHNHRALASWPGVLTEEEGYLLGLLLGDGTLKQEAAILSVWSREQAVNSNPTGASCNVMGKALEYANKLPHRRDFKGWIKVKGKCEYRLELSSIRDLANNMGMFPGGKTITREIEMASSDGYRGFLRGLFDSDGAVIGDHKKGISIRLSQSDISILYAVQRMLLRLGIAGRVYQNRRQAEAKLLPDGRGGLKKYNIKAEHELMISRDNMLVFAESINFFDSEKAQKLKNLIGKYKRKMNKERFLATVSSVVDLGNEDVYDVRVPGLNAFDANGICAHNCGEQPLSPGESCLLGSVNLDRMIAAGGGLDKELLADTVTVAVRFLDNLIDAAEYPLPAIAAATRATRKVGLGFTGLADALIKAGLAYDSAEGRELAGTITGLIQQAAHAASEKLAEEKGCFPMWDKSVFYPDSRRRNAACITIAPTGSVTAMAGCEGYGIEPIFAVAYTKATNVAGDLEVFSPLFLEYVKGYNIPAETLASVAERGSCQGVEGIPEEVAGIFKGAREIAPIDHLLMQAAVQKHVDNAVSKTINLPEEATAEDIGCCFKSAFDLGIKGVTVFREGSKKGTVTVGGGHGARPAAELRRGEILPRPVCAQGMTHRLDTGCGKIYLTINYQPDSGEILETFITTGSDGGCLVYTEAASRLISLAIRGGIPVESITEQLEGTHSCPSYMLARGQGKKVSPGKSCASAIAKQLNQVRAELDQRCNGGCPDKKETGQREICEACGEAALERAEGCLVCRNCGASRC